MSLGGSFRAAPAEGEAPAESDPVLLWLSPIVRSLTVAAPFKRTHRMTCEGALENISRFGTPGPPAFATHRAATNRTGELRSAGEPAARNAEV